MAALIDIVRPGVSLLDQEEHNWEYVGEILGTKWSDKWKREGSEVIIKTLDEINTFYGPVAVLLQNYDGSQAWWKTSSIFE